MNRLTELLQIEGVTSEDDAFVKRVNLDAVVGRVESLMRDASEARKEADRIGESVKSALEKIEAVTKMHASLEGKHDRQRKTFEKRLARVKALCATEKEKVIAITEAAETSRVTAEAEMDRMRAQLLAGDKRADDLARQLQACSVELAHTREREQRVSDCFKRVSHSVLLTHLSLSLKRKPSKRHPNIARK